MADRLHRINDVTDYLFGPSSGKKGLQFQLATQLKRQLSPEGFNTLRTGMWSKLTGVTEGKTDLSPKKLSDNLFEFLNGSGSDLAKVLYSPVERTEMLRLAQAVKMHVPIAGTTNPSGTAPMLSRSCAVLRIVLADGWPCARWHPWCHRRRGRR